jgi:hypothetical protein
VSANREASANIPHDTSTVSSQRSANKTLKSFSKEDRLIIHQTLEKIKDKQSPETYGQILGYTRRLLTGNFTETEKVLVIGEIVRKLSECENCGDDFVAFTDILYKHLAPTSETVNESEYAEPMTLIHLPPPEGETHLTSVGDRVTDHIYAELNCAQQPLLVNEYAAPADLSDALYSEPIQIVSKGGLDIKSATFVQSFGSSVARIFFTAKNDKKTFFIVGFRNV